MFNTFPDFSLITLNGKILHHLIPIVPLHSKEAKRNREPCAKIQTLIACRANNTTVNAVLKHLQLKPQCICFSNVVKQLLTLAAVQDISTHYQLVVWYVQIFHNYCIVICALLFVQYLWQSQFQLFSTRRQQIPAQLNYFFFLFCNPSCFLSFPE